MDLHLNLIKGTRKSSKNSQESENGWQVKEVEEKLVEVKDRESRNNTHFIRVFEEEQPKHWNRSNIWNCNPRKLSGNKRKPEFTYWKGPFTRCRENAP